MAYGPSNNTGQFVPSTNVWDVSQIYSADINSAEFKELFVRLYQTINNVAVVLNNKESGTYSNQEFINTRSYTDPANYNQTMLRPSWRTVFFGGALGPGVTTFAHNLPITASWNAGEIYGEATDNIGFNYYPMSWVGTGGAYLSVRVTGTDIVIDNETGVVFTEYKVVLVFLKA